MSPANAGPLRHLRKTIIPYQRHMNTNIHPKSSSINNAANGKRCKRIRTQFPYEWIYWRMQDAINVQCWTNVHIPSISTTIAREWTKFTIHSESESIHEFKIRPYEYVVFVVVLWRSFMVVFLGYLKSWNCLSTRLTIMNAD